MLVMLLFLNVGLKLGLKIVMKTVILLILFVPKSGVKYINSNIFIIIQKKKIYIYNDKNPIKIKMIKKMI